MFLIRYLYCLLFCCTFLTSQAQLSPIFSSKNNTVNKLCDSAINLSKTKHFLEAMALADSANTLAVRLHDRLAVAQANAAMGWVLMEDYNFSLATEFIEKGLKGVEKLDQPMAKAMLLHQLGLANDRLNAPDKAMKRYLEARELYHSLGEERFVGQLEGNIGRLYFIANDFKTARKYYDQGFEKIKDKQLPLLVSDYYNRIAILMLADGQVEEAYRYNVMGIAHAHQHNLLRELCDFYFNMAGAQYALGNKALAMRYVDSAISLAKANGYDYAQYLGSKAKLVSDGSNSFSPEVEQMFLTAVEEVKKSQNKYMEYSIRNLLGDYYRQVRLFGKAAEQIIIVNEIKDSIANTRNAIALKEIEYKYKDMEKETLLKGYQARSRLKNGLIVMMLLLAILGLYLFFSARKTLHLRQLYFKSKEQLLEQEKANAIYEKELEKDHKERAILEQQLHKEERIALEREMASTQRELTTITLFLQEKNRMLEDLKLQLEQAILHSDGNQKAGLQKLQQNIRHSINFDHDWDKVKLHFEKVHPDFFSRLTEICPALTPNELKHCAYIKMNMSIKETANLLNIDYNSVKMSRYRIKKKLNLDPESDLVEFIQNINPAI